MRTISLCSACQDKSFGMHIELLRSIIDLEVTRLRSSFDFDLSESTNRCFDSSRREKHGNVRIIAPTVFVEKSYARNTCQFEVVGLSSEVNR